jgi:hypothetical protein
MAKTSMDLTAFVGKLLEEQDGDVLREGIRVLSQALMESEVAGLIGARRRDQATASAWPARRGDHGRALGASGDGGLTSATSAPGGRAGGY